MAVRNPERLARVRGGLASLRTPSGRAPIVEALVHTTAQLVVEQGQRAIDPAGDALIPLKHGRRRPLQGRGRIWQDATVEAQREHIVIVFPNFPPEILRAHQEGETIPARRRAATERLAHPRTGRFLSAARARRRKLVYVVPVREHAVGAWQMPKRPVVPEGGLPERYAEKLNRAAAAIVKELVS